MKKWLFRFVIVIAAILLLITHQDIIGLLSNFMIDGLIPGTHTAINTFCTYIFVGLGFYIIYRLVRSVGLDMLKRDALLSAQEEFDKKQVALQNQAAQSSLLALEAEDLELIQRSL